MKLIRRLILLVIYALTITPSTSFAHTLFTYTSDDLQLIEGYLNGDVRDISMIEDPYIPPFSVSFVGEMNNLTGTFFSGDLMVSVFSGYEQFFTAVPVSDSSITLNESGVALAWNFMLAVTRSSYDDVNGPGRDSWVVKSEYGDNTCNCDILTNERDLYIPRPYNTWSYAATLGEMFSEENDVDNWSITSTSVSEPPAWVLILCSLFFLGLAKRAR